MPWRIQADVNARHNHSNTASRERQALYVLFLHPGLKVATMGYSFPFVYLKTGTYLILYLTRNRLLSSVE